MTTGKKPASDASRILRNPKSTPSKGSRCFRS
jgi:hypothetical protein